MEQKPEEHEENRVEAAMRSTGAWLRATGWVLGIIGAIAAFLGLFILFAGENQSVGLGGDLSWRVGDISAAWAYGLLVGGIVLLLVVLALAARVRSRARG
jgi:hypothetical protein